MDELDLTTIVAGLRNEGSDTAGVEVKRALEGFPQGLAPTLSALANKPGGGVLVLGLDEKDDFAPTGVYDVAACQKALAALARSALHPPVPIDVRSSTFEGAVVVAARVPEVPVSQKPCVVAATGKGYVRGYDGDYELSTAEFQAFVGNRSKPTFDLETVPGAGRHDLDDALVASYVATCRSSSTQLARFDDEDILVKTNVLTRDGVVRIAGLLALGTYPQEWFPSLVVQASVAPGPGDPPGTRARDLRVFDGPIPAVLEEVEQWVRRNTSYRVVFGSDGHGRDVPEYPQDAVRELVANALMHRDLGPHATNRPVSLRLDQSRLVIANPGGLWATSVNRLGVGEGPTQRRNEALVRICQNVRTASGRRVVEGLGDGIRVVLERLDEAGMTRPRFDDQGIAFTVVVPNHALLDPDDIAWLGAVVGDAPANDVQRHVLASMRHGVTWTNRDLRAQFPMDSIAARTTLQGLVEMGLAEAVGDGRGRRYVLAPRIPDAVPVQVSPPPDRYRPGRQPAVSVGDDSGPNSLAVLGVLADGPRSMSDLTQATGLTRRQVEYVLQGLRGAGRVELVGRPRSRSAVYRLSPS